MDFSLHSIMEWLVQFVGEIGYPGVFIFAMIGGTFLPIPEELTIIPAGYLAYQGTFNLPLLYIFSVTGSICGSCLNYWLALKYGRPLLLRYGKFLMLSPEKLAKMENYFVEHGAISVFTGRLLPGAKHYITFPAGLGRMKMRPFLIYLSLAAALWIAIILGLGYEIGNNEEMIAIYLKRVKMSVVVFVAIIVAIYSLFKWRQRASGNRIG